MIQTLRKGNAWRVKVAQLLGQVGFVEKRGLGDPGDDLTVWLSTVTLSVECKNEKATTLAAWITQAETQCPQGRIPLVVAHRRGRDNAEDGYVIMSGSRFIQLLRQLRPGEMDV